MLRHSPTIDQQKIEGAKSFEVIIGPLEGKDKQEAISLQKRLIAEMFPDNPVQAIDYDVYSEYFAVKKSGAIIGCGRLILCNPSNPSNSFQVDEYPEKLVNIDYSKISKQNIAEMSAFYILKEHQEFLSNHHSKVIREYLTPDAMLNTSRNHACL